MINLNGKSHTEKVDLKSNEIIKTNFKKLENISNFEIEIQSVNKIDGGIEVFAKAFKNGEQLGFGSDGSIDIERFRFFNPPLLVPDENGDITREIKQIDGSVLTRRLREDPKNALLQSLAHTISLVGILNQKIKQGSIGTTTDTFYPAAGANSPVDGWVDKEDSSNWATTRDSASGQFASVTDTGDNIVVGKTAGGVFQLSRVFTMFDTSSIGTDSISSATLSFFGTSKGTAGTSAYNYRALVGATCAATNNLSTSDYSTFGTTKFSTDIDNATWNTAGYNDYVLNASGISAINKTGVTNAFCCQMGFDYDNFSFDGANDTYSYQRAYSADQTGTSNDPKLVVVHAPATSAFGFRSLKGVGI